VRSSRSGFTLIEVMVAVTMLAVGVVALASAAASTTRMIGRGRIDTRAAQLATLKLDSLRALALTATPRCTGLATGGPDAVTNVSLSWTVTVAGTGRTVAVSASYATVGGTRTDVLTTYIEC
jgi:prepilin-type N-terminal cleavage/methylation domain-containing protein